MKGYAKFGAMIATSTVVMFGLMYLNTYQWDHVLLQRDARLHGARHGRDDGRHHARLHVGDVPEHRAPTSASSLGSAAVFAMALWLVRSQETIDDVSYMKAMIPHHSIAILTSGRAHINDPRVRKLADGIIEAQKREIGEMKALDRGPGAKR